MKKLLLASLALVAGAISVNAAEITETLTVDLFGKFSGQNYQDVTYTSDATGIKYSGNMCKANSANGEGMQFRTTSGKEAGLVAVENPNGYKIVSVKVSPSTTASTTNQYDVYGSTAAYTEFKDLYSEATAGTLIGSGTTESTVTPKTTDLKFFGFRANKNAVYINSIVITYETEGAVADDRKPAGLSFPEAAYTASLSDGFTAPTLTKATTAAAAYSSSVETVATVDAATGAVTLVGAGTTVISAKAEANDAYLAGNASYTLTVIDGLKVTLVSSMSNGTYAIYFPGNGYSQLIGQAAGRYGYSYLAATTVENNSFIANKADLLEFTSTDKGYTIKDSTGVFWGMDASHWGSINLYATPDDNGSNCYWTISFDGDSAKISNTGREGAYMSCKQYSGKWELVTTDNADQPLPQLFVANASGSAVEGIAVEATDAAPVYYNLQGVRVANPEKGLYIVVKDGKSSKVVF